MAKFVIFAKDRPNSFDLRLATRPVHLEHLKTAADRLLFFGPTLGEDGKPNGSLVVADFADLAEAEAFAAADPYSKAGLFESVTIRAWNQVTF